MIVVVSAHGRESDTGNALNMWVTAPGQVVRQYQTEQLAPVEAQGYRVEPVRRVSAVLMPRLVALS